MRRSAALGRISALTLAAAGSRPVLGADPVPIRIGYAPVELSAAFFAAIEAGFFKKAGLAVDAQPMSTGAATIAALIGGTIDVGDANVVSMAQACERGIPVAYVALDGLYSAANPADALVVSASSPIATARDLNGKTIAINVLNGIAYIGVRSGIDHDGGDSSTIRFVEMPFSVMPDALLAHRVDAILVSQPELRRATEAGSRVLSYPYNAIAPRFLVAGWLGVRTWVKGNVAVARRFHDAMLEADIWSNQHHDRTAQFVQKYTKVDLATVQSMTRAVFPERSDMSLAQPVINAAAKYGLLKSAFPAADLFSPEVMG
jgi:NitT/TauT family transport system substrate-binding protein